MERLVFLHRANINQKKLESYQLLFAIPTYLLVHSSHCSTHGGLVCNLHVTSLMALIIYLDLPLATLIFTILYTSACILHRSALTISFHLIFGLPRDVSLPTLKLIIFLVHEVSSCRYKWPDTLCLLDLVRFLLRFSVGCFCFILILLN